MQFCEYRKQIDNRALICLFIKSYFFYSHNKSANNIFSYDFLDQRTGSHHPPGTNQCIQIPRPCLVQPEIQKVFKIPRHIESCGTCMNH